MKKQKKYKLVKFSTAFINEVDNLLQDVYTKTLTRERFFLFFSLIARQSSSHPEKFYRGVKARLKSSYLQNVLGSRNLKQIIDISIQKGIVKTDNSYIIGKKSKDYWISLQFSAKVKKEDLKIQTWVLTTNYKLYKKIRKMYTKKSFPKKFHKIYDNLHKIKFDVERANRWLESLYNSGYFNDNGIFNTNKYSVYQRMINDMVEKKFIIVEDSYYNRVFTTFNLMKKELRNFCTIDGEKIVEIDLKSSQPYLLASRLLKKQPNNDNIKQFYNDVTTKDIYTLLADKYKDIKGDYEYEDIELIEDDDDNVIDRYSVTKTLTRDNAKVEFLRVIFKGLQGGATLLNVFKQNYQDVYRAMNKIKKKKNLAVVLQKDESKIFRYVENQYDDFILSCHDSLYVKESDLENLNNKLNERFDELGYSNYKLS